MAEFPDASQLAAYQVKDNFFDPTASTEAAANILASRASTAQQQLQNQITQRSSAAQQTAFENQQIADAARKALADPDNPDAPFEAAVKNGALSAGQFIGRTNPFLLNRILEAYGSQEPSPDVSVGAGVSPLQGQGASAQAGAGGLQGGGTASLDERLASIPPDQQVKALQNLNAVSQAAYAIRMAADPVAEYAKQHAALTASGVQLPPAFPPTITSQLGLVQMEQAVAANEPIRQALQARVAQNSAGLPPPLIQPKTVQSRQGTITSIQPNASGTGVATQLTGPDLSMRQIGSTPDGRPVTLDENTGKAMVNGQTYDGAVNAKPTGAADAWMTKYKAALALTPNDQEAAMAIANGKRSMSGPDARKAAITMAQHDADELQKQDDATIAAGGAPPPRDWRSFMNDRTAYYSQSLTPGAAASPGAKSAAQAVPPPAPAAVAKNPALMPAQALSALKSAAGKPVTFNNGTTWKMGANGQPQQVSP